MQTLVTDLRVHQAKSLQEAVDETVDVVVLAVKPQVMGGVLDELAERITEDQLLISLAAVSPHRFHSVASR